MKTLMTWKQDGYLHYSHVDYGMWIIEQRRRRYYVSLMLNDAQGANQEMGEYATLAKAKAGALRDHKQLAKQD